MAALIASAVFGGDIDWFNIDLDKIPRTVRRLQIRIAKANREERWNTPCNGFRPIRSTANFYP